jgi:hypothetical protein
MLGNPLFLKVLNLEFIRQLLEGANALEEQKALMARQVLQNTVHDSPGVNLLAGVPNPFKRFTEASYRVLARKPQPEDDWRSDADILAGGPRVPGASPVPKNPAARFGEAAYRVFTGKARNY